MTDDDLRVVCGGMRLDPTLRDPIEDRRHETRRQFRWRMRHPSPLPPPPHIGPRHPNDLPHQAGVDDIRAHHGRWSRMR